MDSDVFTLESVTVLPLDFNLGKCGPCMCREVLCVGGAECMILVWLYPYRDIT